MSVGQAQRVLIAMAVMHRPALLIADEATSALDVITQSEILALFRELNRAFGMAILYISHDLASVAGICDRIAILHEGQIVETGTTEQVLLNPRHEYTQRLMAAMPKMPQRPGRRQSRNPLRHDSLFASVSLHLCRHTLGYIPASKRGHVHHPRRGTECPAPAEADRVAHSGPQKLNHLIKNNDLRAFDWLPLQQEKWAQARSFPHRKG